MFFIYTPSISTERDPIIQSDPNQSERYKDFINIIRQFGFTFVKKYFTGKFIVEKLPGLVEPDQGGSNGITKPMLEKIQNQMRSTIISVFSKGNEKKEIPLELLKTGWSNLLTEQFNPSIKDAVSIHRRDNITALSSVVNLIRIIQSKNPDFYNYIKVNDVFPIQKCSTSPLESTCAITNRKIDINTDSYFMQFPITLTEKPTLYFSSLNAVLLFKEIFKSIHIIDMLIEPICELAISHSFDSYIAQKKNAVDQTASAMARMLNIETLIVDFYNCYILASSQMNIEDPAVHNVYRKSFNDINNIRVEKSDLETSITSLADLQSFCLLKITEAIKVLTNYRANFMV